MRIGVIGTGFAGAMHARSAQGLDDVRVTAIAAATPEEAAPIAEEVRARIESEPLALCSAKDVDLVVVATPTHLHADYAIAAAKAGKHVFCEKPLARTREQAEAIVRACEDARVALAVGHVVRYFPEYQIGKRMIGDGTLGKPAIATLVRGNFPVGSARAWYLDPEKSGGVVLDLMLHDLDTARWWLASPRASTRGAWTPARADSTTRSRRSASPTGRSCTSRAAGPSTLGSARASSSAATEACSCTTAARRRRSSYRRPAVPAHPR